MNILKAIILILSIHWSLVAAMNIKETLLKYTETPLIIKMLNQKTTTNTIIASTLWGIFYFLNQIS